MLPSLKNLEYLIALSEYLNFSKAAKTCFVSQSTLSAGIAKLEQDLNTILVERNNKSVALTKIGIQIIDQARQVINSTQDLVNIAKTDFFQSKINIGIIPTISPYLLPQLIQNLQATYPQLNLSFVEEKSEVLLDKVQSLEIDFAIFAFPYDIPNNIEAYTLFKESLIFIQHKDRSQTNIKQHELLLLEQGNCLRDQIISSCNIKQNQISECSCSSLATLIAMVNMNTGVSLLPEMAIQQNILKPYPDIKIDKNTLAQAGREVGIIYRKQNSQAQKIIKIAQLIQHPFKE